MTGDHFVLLKDKNGEFRWELWGGHHPVGPIARSGRDYPSAASAKRAMQSAYTAMAGVADENGALRIEDRSAHHSETPKV
jgi:uncharacterized protein YegP (UPF0339 family)